MPDGVITLQDSLDLRRSSQLKSEYVLAIPITQLDAHQTSSLNSIRRTWNNTPVELRRINNNGIDQELIENLVLSMENRIFQVIQRALLIIRNRFYCVIVIFCYKIMGFC